MKYGIISDIHGNLNALTTVLQELNREKIDQLICLGDLVGYGPEPNECIQLIKKSATIVIAGNHDHAAIGKIELRLFNRYARNAMLWTRQTLTKASISFLRNLKLTAIIDDVQFVHATPHNPDLWNYISSTFEALVSFIAFDKQLCFVGHSHVPTNYILSEQNKKVVNHFDQQITIEPNKRYILNIGSVGQPRDLNPKATYATYNTVTRRYKLHRVAYNIAQTQQKMRKAKLDDRLISRLAAGR